MFNLILSPIWFILRAAHFKRPTCYQNKLHTNGIGYGLFQGIHGRGERELNIKAAKIRMDNLIEYLNILTMFHYPLSARFRIADFGLRI